MKKRKVLVLDGTFPPEGETEGLSLEVVHPIKKARHVFVPHLSPANGFVAGDFVFRCPAVIVADRKRAIAFIPDLDDVGAAQGFRVWLDYDHPSRRVTLCAGNYRHEGHVFFVEQPAPARGQRVKIRMHVLYSDRRADRENPYGMVARWTWKRWGRPRYATGGSQRAPLERSMSYVERWAFSKDGWGEEVWQSFELNDRKVGAPVFIVDVTRHPSVPVEERRWREPRSVWNQAWFSTQRCANGLLLHGRQKGSADLQDRARSMTEVALAAPQQEGLFPSVVTPLDHDQSWANVRWTNSDRRPDSASDQACHIVDAAFTCRMLLEWNGLTDEPRALKRTRRFADRIVALQLQSGAFPGWVEPDGSTPPELAESAESAMTVALLFDLLELESNARWMDTAKDGLQFLERIVQEARWEDFETYYSCARWGTPGERVTRNGVFKQNTLSIAWCADAFAKAYVALRKRRYLDLARRCVDELSLYQAVWDPPFLPAPAHGGFGVMNADSEWNDARQSLFAPLYLRLYELTGEAALFERGVSALRASFSMLYGPDDPALAAAYEARFPFFGPESYGFMMENQAHSGSDPIGTFTIYTWGNGSALASAATVKERYGDVYVDLERRRAFGIDGGNAELDGDWIRFADRYGRDEVTAVCSSGVRLAIPVRNGIGKVRVKRARG